MAEQIENRRARGSHVEVCVSIDVEFSIAGAFTYPDRCRPVAEPAVLGNVDGVSHGLPFILRVLDEFDIKATFFLEALNATYFGSERMGRFAREIYDRGHDVQLHLHPGWLFFGRSDWQARLAARDRPNDSCSGRSPEELRAIISRGVEIFESWHLPRPVALRTGSLRVDATLYPVMKEFGIRLSSSVGVGRRIPRDRALRVYSGCHRFGDVTEVPVLSFKSFLGDRLLTVSGCGSKEARSVLKAAAEQGVSPIVLLTHPHEFVKARDDEYRITRPHRVNQARLRRFCEFLRKNDDRFVTRTFREAAKKWESLAGPRNAILRTPITPVMLRAVDNKLSDWIWMY
jgi:peptidoglycan/xylan/chitin deacetylase (PgdA/CDA1 family)